MIAANPAVASVFGLDLLLMPALSLVLVTEAQMFVVGGSEIDLGVGAFAGLVSVLSATWLHDQTLLGAAAIVAALVAYALIGAVIQGRKIPAIIVTLGRVFHLGWPWVLDPADAWRDESRVAHRHDQLVDQPVRSHVRRSDCGGRAYWALCSIALR